MFAESASYNLGKNLQERLLELPCVHTFPPEGRAVFTLERGDMLGIIGLGVELYTYKADWVVEVLPSQLTLQAMLAEEMIADRAQHGQAGIDWLTFALSNMLFDQAKDKLTQQRQYLAEKMSGDFHFALWCGTPKVREEEDLATYMRIIQVSFTGRAYMHGPIFPEAEVIYEV